MRPHLLALIVAVLVVGVGGAFADSQEWLTPITGPVLRVVTPIQTLVGAALEPLADAVGSFSSVRALKEENARLKEAVRELNAEIVRLREAEIENKRLAAELKYEGARPDLEFISTRVVGHDPTGLMRALLLDKGQEEGIRAGMVVVVPGGLVGKVVKVYPSNSKVLLVSDPRSAVAATVQRAQGGAPGLVSGLPSGELIMRYLPQGVRIYPKDVVVTSGLGGGYPQGLFIGQVVKVHQNDAELFQEAVLEPAAELSSLEQVLVISNFLPQELPSP